LNTRRRSLTVADVTDLAGDDGVGTLPPSVSAARDAWLTREVEPFGAGATSSNFWRLFSGDSHEVIKSFADSSVNCVVTSPAYYWQRDYGAEGQYGMEPTPDEFVENLRRLFNDIQRVLAPDGTVFLNLGDTYYSAKGKPHGTDAKHRSRRMAGLRAVDGPGLGLPRKSLIGIPWRVALALQADGWTLRSDIVWARQGSLPEPTAKDRPWRSYEHVFLFSRSPRYYFDRERLGGEEDIWFIEPDRNAESRGTHYAPFPRALARRCIECGCPEGGVVLDPFVGGGTTMCEALSEGRSAVGIDLNHDFLKLVRERLEHRDDNGKLIRLNAHRSSGVSG
jgi:DNA modification methylase